MTSWLGCQQSRCLTVQGPTSLIVRDIVTVASQWRLLVELSSIRRHSGLTVACQGLVFEQAAYHSVHHPHARLRHALQSRSGAWPCSLACLTPGWYVVCHALTLRSTSTVLRHECLALCHVVGLSKATGQQLVVRPDLCTMQTSLLRAGMRVNNRLSRRAARSHYGIMVSSLACALSQIGDGAGSCSDETSVQSASLSLRCVVLAMSSMLAIDVGLVDSGLLDSSKSPAACRARSKDVHIPMRFGPAAGV
jgi:hypothetical protein